jgi:outer membrane lipoprotein
MYAVLTAFGVAGCAHPPQPIDIAPLVPITVAEAQAKDISDRVVRWGGTIVSSTVEPDQTCFEVVSRPLDKQARPFVTDETDGRFVACASGFYDPAIYGNGREITVVGTLIGPTTGKIGEREYTFPRVAASAIFLWPKRRPEEVVLYPAWVGPYYAFPPWWGPFWW